MIKDKDYEKSKVLIKFLTWEEQMKNPKVHACLLMQIIGSMNQAYRSIKSKATTKI